MSERISGVNPPRPADLARPAGVVVPRPRMIVEPQVRLEGKWTVHVWGEMSSHNCDVVIFPDGPWTQFMTAEGQLYLTNRPVTLVAE